MVLSWLKAHEEVEAGCDLADQFPPTAAKGDSAGAFLRRAVSQIRLRNLNFYKRVRFAFAFRWRLLENGVEADTAHEMTQTLLMQALIPPQAHSPEREVPVDSVARKARPKVKGTVVQQADEALARGEFREALALYEEWVASRPRDFDALNNIGVVLSSLGRHEEAEKHYRTLLAGNPNLPAVHCNLGSLLHAQGRLQDAESCFRRALVLKGTDISARSNLGLTFVLQGRLDSARAEFEKVLRIAPRDAGTLYGMGVLARTEGRFKEAEEFFRRALVSNPKLSRAWAALAGVRKMDSSDALWLKRAEQTADSLKSLQEEAEVRFAIGKYFDDLGKHSSAFESYRRANNLLKKVAAPYDAVRHSRYVDDMLRLYTPRNIAAATAAGMGSDSAQPVFVLGMPRSGTSLVEQILASHPSVAAAGELPFWNDLGRRREELLRREIPDLDQRQKIAQEYLRTLSSHGAPSRYVVDKTPSNCDLMGLIHTVFPNARFIYMQRDPADTCLSCYFQHFSLSLNWSLDLSDLAQYYTEHQRLFWHWRTVLPAHSILEVPYEELVSNQDHWTRAILDFLGLEWDEGCLQFHDTQRPVSTASFWQVRQPLYPDSVNRARHYSKYLGPLRKLKSH